MTSSAKGAAPVRTRTTLAMIADDYHVSKVERVLDGASDRATEHGINLVCAVMPAAPEQCPIRDLIGPANCDGVMVLSSIVSNFERSQERIREFFKSFEPLPCVSLGDPFEGVRSIKVDNRSGMRDVISHLIKVHHIHKIAFIRGPVTNLEAEERFAVYQQVLEENGIPFDPDLVAEGNWTHASGATAVYTLKDLRHRKFAAIAAANDAMAGGAFEALHARGIRVPLDVAVVGFDNFDGTGYALTTVNQPVYEMGRRAADMVLALSQGKSGEPQLVTLPTEVVLRRSCGCFGADVRNAAAETAPTSPVSLLALRREAISQAILRAASGADAEAPPEWPGRLFAAFLHEMTDGKRGELLSELDAILMQEWLERRHSRTWQDVISELRREALPCLGPHAVVSAENIWHQARVLIAEAAQRVRAHRDHLYSLRTLKLMDVSTVFPCTDIKTLAENFAQRMPALGIERCYAVVFESDGDGDGHGPGSGDGAKPEWSRLIMALDEEESTPLDSEGIRFPARQLLPPDVLPDYRPVTLIALPLAKAGRNMGIIFFEKSDVEFYIYQTLARQFSEPLSRIAAPGCASAQSAAAPAAG